MYRFIFFTLHSIHVVKQIEIAKKGLCVESVHFIARERNT